MKRRALNRHLAVAVALFTTAPGLARAERAVPVEESRTERVWYGWQTLVVDGIALTAPFALASAGAESEVAANTFLLGYALGGPAVHFAHGNVGRGFGSFGLRVGLPLGGAAVGALATSRAGCDYCALGGAVLGTFGGIGGAIALDAAWLAYDTERTLTLGVVPDTSSADAAPRVVVSGTF